MTRKTSQHFDSDLDTRRKRLGMSAQVVARRTGLSLSTVQRILRGRYSHATFGNVVRVARELGMEVGLRPGAGAEIRTMRREQAYAKARTLVAMAQGTSALEAQAVEASVVKEAIESTAHELLKSKRKLWAA